MKHFKYIALLGVLCAGTMPMVSSAAKKHTTQATAGHIHDAFLILRIINKLHELRDELFLFEAQSINGKPLSELNLKDIPKNILINYIALLAKVKNTISLLQMDVDKISFDTFRKATTNDFKSLTKWLNTKLVELKKELSRRK